MAEIKDIMAYIISNYPENLRHELSNARLTKMIYLSDWHSCINRGSQITDISWFFDDFGPFVHDISETAKAYPSIFDIDTTKNSYGQPKRIFRMRSKYTPTISGEERASVDHIIEITRKLYWKDFIRLVYGTHPVASSDRYSFLDLSKKAKEYVGMNISGNT